MTVLFGDIKSSIAPAKDKGRVLNPASGPPGTARAEPPLKGTKALKVFTNKTVAGIRSAEPPHRRSYAIGALGPLLLAALAIGCAGCSLFDVAVAVGPVAGGVSGEGGGGAAGDGGFGGEPIGGGSTGVVVGGGPAPEPNLCGNGVLDAGERCDDGNEDSGDGCSSACVLEGEPDECGSGGAVLLLDASGLSVGGNTLDAKNHTGASCTNSVAGTHHYGIVILAPNGGTAVFSVEADYDVAFTLLADCNFPFPMNNCSSETRSEPIAPGGRVLSVLVTGLGNAAGAYTLRAHLEP